MGEESKLCKPHKLEEARKVKLEVKAGAVGRRGGSKNQKTVRGRESGGTVAGGEGKEEGGKLMSPRRKTGYLRKPRPGARTKKRLRRWSVIWQENRQEGLFEGDQGAAVEREREV